VWLKPLRDEEGSRLLLQYLPNHVSTSQHSASLAKAISKEVCGFPLDLVGLAGYMVDSSIPLSETLSDLQNHVSRDLDSNSATFQYEKPVNSAFDMSLKSLSKPALSVLRVISMLSPDMIPESLFSGKLDPVMEFCGFSTRTQFRQKIRTPLRNRHLIDFHESNTPGGSPSYSIHRRLQRIIQDDMDQIDHQLAFDRAVALIGSVFPPVTDHMVPMYDDMRLYQESIGHVTRLEEVFRIRNKTSKILVGDMAFVELLIGAAFYLYEIRLGTSGLTFLETATPICAAKVATGQNSAQWVKLWATALQITWAIIGASTGIAERQSTTDRIVKVLELRKAYVEADCSDDSYAGRVLLANVHNDMTVQLLDNGEYDKAEDHVKTSIKMKAELQRERMMPLYQFAEQNKNLALVYAGQGRNKESVGLSEEAVRVLPNEEEYGVHTIFLFVHGICLANAGLFDGALDAFTKCYKVRIEAFGMHGMTTLHSLYAVAYMQYRLGRYSEARYVSPL
jgi:tetratricopeptide (TPR) repeat protein